jgi:hypothetical protein
MRLGPWFVLFFGLALQSPAATITVPILDGFAVKGFGAGGAVTFRLEGDNFLVTGAGTNARSWVSGPCSPGGIPFAGCSPGDSFRLEDAIGVSDQSLSGQLTYGGVTMDYQVSNSESSSNFGGFSLFSTVGIPSVGDSPPATLSVTTPFTMFGGFCVACQLTPDPVQFFVLGQGTATYSFTLLRTDGTVHYTLHDSRFDFQSSLPPGAIPEPSTTLLTVAAGFAFLLFRITGILGQIRR